jgi:hypothetical protein
MRARGCRAAARPENRLMLTPLACHVSLHPMRELLASAGPPRVMRPGAAARRARRRVARKLPRFAVRRTTPVPAAAFVLEAVHQLTTPQLWGVWTVAHLECKLALSAWRSGPSEHRGRARRAYRSALVREERAALLLAGRT